MKAASSLSARSSKSFSSALDSLLATGALNAILEKPSRAVLATDDGLDCSSGSTVAFSSALGSFATLLFFSAEVTNLLDALRAASIADTGSDWGLGATFSLMSSEASETWVETL